MEAVVRCAFCLRACDPSLYPFFHLFLHHRNSSLAVAPIAQLEYLRTEASRHVEENSLNPHPLRLDGAELNVMNCFVVFIRFCTSVISSFSCSLQSRNLLVLFRFWEIMSNLMTCSGTLKHLLRTRPLPLFFWDFLRDCLQLRDTGQAR